MSIFGPVRKYDNSRNRHVLTPEPVTAAWSATYRLSLDDLSDAEVLRANLRAAESCIDMLIAFGRAAS